MSAVGEKHPRRGSVWVTVPMTTLFAEIDLALRARWTVVPVGHEQLDRLPDPVDWTHDEIPSLLIGTLGALEILEAARLVAPLLLICDESEIRGLSAEDCDDVLVVPWSTRELCYRVSRMTPIRRYVAEGVRIEWQRYAMKVYRQARSVDVSLSTKQYVILDTLLRNPRPVSRDVLCHMAKLPAGRSFDMQLSRIRAKFAVVEVRLSVRLAIEGNRTSGFCLSLTKSSIPE